MSNTCKSCPNPLPDVPLRGRPRTHCLTCRPPRLAPVQVLAAVQAEAAKRPAVASLVEQVTAELEAAGQLDTVDGRAAVLLASKAEGVMTNASQAAAAVRELRTVMAAALQGAKAADGIDELGAKRRQVAGQ